METQPLRSPRSRGASAIEDTPPLPSTSGSVSPPKKRKRRSLLDTEKVMVLNVYKHVCKEKFEQEKLNQDPDITDPDMIRVSKNECVLKTSEILGISRTSIYRVLKENKENKSFSSPKKTGLKKTFKDKYDEFTFSAIRRKVHVFFNYNEAPTVAKVLQAVNDDEDLPKFSLTTMRRILKYLNFKYIKRTRRSMLIERQDIISWRRNYLLKIKDLRRNGTPIYYQDETWVNEGHTLSKTWVDLTIETPRQAFLEGLSTGLKAPTGKGRRLIISHIGNEDGFVGEGLLMFTSKSGKEDYHQDMNSDSFEEWLRGILPKLKPNSVLVLDNAPYHSRKIDSFPNMSWLKARIVEWLKNKNIDIPEKATKSDLIDIAKPYKDSCEKYVVDEMAREKGITVLRLPPYHCELNPIELVWAQVKGHVARQNKTFKMDEVKKLFIEGLNKVTPERWRECVNHVIKTEDKMLGLDHLIDSVSDRFIINVSENDSDDDDDEITDDSD